MSKITIENKMGGGKIFVQNKKTDGAKFTIILIS